MATEQDVRTWRGHTLVDRDGDKIGKIEDVYLDRGTGEPEWVAVKTGLFGSNVSFVPIEGATQQGDDVQVAYEKDLVKDAPNIDPDGELSPEEERRLYQHYGRGDYDEWTSDSEDRTEAMYGRDTRDDVRGERYADGDDVRGEGVTDRVGDDVRGDRYAEGDDVRGDRYAEGDDVRGDRYAEGDDATVGRSGTAGEDAMTRSEEELSVGTQRRETGRARLRKYVETETVEQTVPVRREEVRVEREPITDENMDAAMSGSEITEAEHEVTLHAEEPVVEKRTVPKERVRLDKDVHTDEETVSDEVRRERIETEGDAEGRL
jgi:uncharacterized protein (TIGR02271 family)